MGIASCGGRSGLDALALDDGTGGSPAAAGTGGATFVQRDSGSAIGWGPGAPRDAGSTTGSHAGGGRTSDDASATGGRATLRDAGAEPSGSLDAGIDAGSESTPDAARPCNPVLVSTSPASGAVDVPASAEVTVVVLCEPDATAGGFDLVLTSGGRTVDGATSASAGAITLVPAKPLSLATTYRVEVRRGNEALYAWQFTTQEGAWHDAETVATVPDLADFVFAVSNEGEGIVSYIGNSTVSSRRFDVVTGLSPTTELVSSPGNPVQELNAGIDDQGRAAVGWREYSNEPSTGGQYVLNAASQQYGSAWGSIQRIDGPARNSIPDIFEIGVSRTGKRLLLWTDHAVQLTDIDHASDGPFTPSPGNSSEHAEFAFESGGAAWVVWDTWDFSGQAIGTRRLSAAGTWGDPVALGQTSASSRCAEHLAVADDGSVMVLFPAMVQSIETLIARRFTPISGWSDPRALDTVGSNGTATMIGASVAMDPEGNALAVWATETTVMVGRDGGPTVNHPQSELRSQRFTVSDGWAAEHETLDVPVGIPGTLPNASFAANRRALALDDAANGFLVVVTEGGEVRAARWLAGSGWQPSMTLGTVPLQEWPSPSAAPQLSVNKNGRAVALWRNGSNLIMRRFTE